MVFPDTFNPDKRFIFSNWSNEDFTGMWGGQPFLIKAGETKEFQMYLAYHFTKHFVDREMTRNGCSSLMGNDEARRAYEEKTLAEISGSTESPALAALREQIKEEVMEAESKSKKKVKAVEIEKKGEFEDLKK